MKDKPLEVIGFVFVMTMATIFVIHLATGLGAAAMQLYEWILGVL